jgi:polysaccharide export outer membrane protein
MNTTRKDRPSWGRAVIFAICLSTTSFSFVSARAQEQDSRPRSVQESGVRKDAPKDATDESVKIIGRDDRYRIGPGDLLEVRVFNRPQLSREAVRVDADGMIHMPLVDDAIHASCLTESELGREIETHYLKYQRRPKVDVFVKEYNSQPVAVIGAVDKPGRFQLQRRVRLLELISFAGGPTDKAGKRIQIAHTGSRRSCRENASRAVDAEAIAALPSPTQTAAASPAGKPESNADFDVFTLSETLRGDDQANPYVNPGDIINVPEAEQAFVVGNVYRPATIPLKEPTTVSQAIAMAGGALPDTRSNGIRIIRRGSEGAGKIEITVDLQQVIKRKADDVMLQPGDIVEVPVSTGKRLIRTFSTALGPGLGNLPIYVLR